MTSTVADIMSKNVATCGRGDRLHYAAQLMWEHRRGCVVVLDETGGLVGIVTDRDVCMAAYTQGRRLEDIAVTTAMSRPAYSCAPTATIEEAEDLMMAHGVRRLAVVDSFGQLQGLISLDDIARCGAAWDREGDIDMERAALTLGEISRRTISPDQHDPDAPETDLRALVQNGVAALKTLRDEIRVDLNLAGKELRHKLRRARSHP
jgi:CBS domain-containing protein